MRLCLLKGCQQRFHPRQARQRYCSVNCRREARKPPRNRHSYCDRCTAGIARLVTAETFSMVFVGAVAGVALGMGSVRFIESLLFDVKATDLTILAIPSLTIFVSALLAAVPAVVRAIRIDPVAMLRSE
jgi:hypothetical protein